MDFCSPRLILPEVKHFPSHGGMGGGGGGLREVINESWCGGVGRFGKPLDFFKSPKLIFAGKFEQTGQRRRVIKNSCFPDRAPPAKLKYIGIEGAFKKISVGQLKMVFLKEYQRGPFG